MNINEAKETLEAIGYPVHSDDWDSIIEELHNDYRPQVVGGSMNTLGDAAPLYMRSGNAAFMVDNKDDLYRACVRIKNIQDARKGAEIITIPSDTYAFNRKVIKNALDAEAHFAQGRRDFKGRCSPDYLTESAEDGSMMLRNTEQVMKDLLSDDKKLNAKAVEAFKAILIINRV